MRNKMIKKNELKTIIKNIKEQQKMVCSKCGNTLNKSNKKRLLGICSWKSCKFRQQHWTDTFFEGIKIKKAKCLRVLELWMEKAPIHIISFVTGVSRVTINKLLNKISEIVVAKYDEEFSKIGGKDIIVEIDESKFGKRKYNRGHHVDGVWIFGMVERTEERRIHLLAVDDRKANTLKNVLVKHVDSESVIYSDCWKGYSNLIEQFSEHLTVNHSENYKNPITGVHTNTIEGNWCGIKLTIPAKNRTRSRINLYLTRFMLLRNEKTLPLVSLIKYLF